METAELERKDDSNIRVDQSSIHVMRPRRLPLNTGTSAPPRPRQKNVLLLRPVRRSKVSLIPGRVQEPWAISTEVPQWQDVTHNRGRVRPYLKIEHPLRNGATDSTFVSPTDVGMQQLLRWCSWDG